MHIFPHSPHTHTQRHTALTNTPMHKHTHIHTCTYKIASLLSQLCHSLWHEMFNVQGEKLLKKQESDAK